MHIVIAIALAAFPGEFYLKLRYLEHRNAARHSGALIFVFIAGMNRMTRLFVILIAIIELLALRTPRIQLALFVVVGLAGIFVITAYQMHFTKIGVGKKLPYTALLLSKKS